METKTPTIRPAKAGDLEAIARIERACFPGPKAYPKEDLAQLIFEERSVSLVDTMDSEVRGFIIATYHEGSRLTTIETIDVSPEHRNKGIGSRLLTAVEKEMKTRGTKHIILEVAERNENALWVYKKAGYNVLENINNYYVYEHEGSRNALRMCKALA